MRVFLSALGIAIGIAAMIGVVGISTSSQEELNRKMASLGTNLLTVVPGQSFGGDQSHLPDEAVGMVGAAEGVESVSAIGRTGKNVYRNDHIPKEETGGIGVYAARIDLAKTVTVDVVDGRWLNSANDRYPAAVLGAGAARHLGARGRPLPPATVPRARAAGRARLSRALSRPAAGHARALATATSVVVRVVRSEAHGGCSMLGGQ